MIKLPFPQAIIFDKDGTLMDYDSFWIPVAKVTTQEILEKYGAPLNLLPDILYDAGLRGETVDLRGIMCGGTYAMIAELYGSYLEKANIPYDADTLYRETVEYFEKNTACGGIAPACEDLRSFLLSLKENGIRLFCVTTDHMAPTRFCLQTLGVEDLFEELFTDDGIYPAKPDPYVIDYLVKKYGFDKSRMIMVGDTPTDQKFAKNGGIHGIGVALAEFNRDYLSPLAEAVLHDISQITELFL